LKLSKLLIAIFLTIILTSCSFLSDREVELILKYEVGDKFIISTEILGGDNAIYHINQNMEAQVEIIGLEDSIYTMDLELLNVQSTIRAGGVNVHYDSKENKPASKMTKEERQMHSEFKDFYGRKVEFQMNSKGEKTSRFKDKDGRVVRGNPLDLETIIIPFPEIKVKEGSTWSTEAKTSLFSSSSNTYEVVNLGYSEVQINSKTYLSGLAGMLKSKYASGEYIVNRETGNLKLGTLNMELKGGGKLRVTYKIK